ncbi:MAG: hypothetical protein AAF513_06295 [Pseudomonadota bacterium]
MSIFNMYIRCLALLVLTLVCGSCETPAAKTAELDRDTGTVPDLNGLWQALGTAHWSLEGGHAIKGPATNVLGALGGIPAGRSYVVGGSIPYTAEAAAKRADYRAEWNQWDPAVKCFIPGIPRQTYMPLPFHIVQSENKIFIAYEWGSNSRMIHLDRPGTRAELPSWMGYSTARWEGDTLVVEVTDQMPDTWLDATGTWHSDELKVTERYTLRTPNHIHYEATIEDPQVFTEPWTIAMPLYRRMEDDARLLEYKCVPFAEDAVYGHLRRGEDMDKPNVKNLF